MKFQTNLDDDRKFVCETGPKSTKKQVIHNVTSYIIIYPYKKTAYKYDMNCTYIIRMHCKYVQENNDGEFIEYHMFAAHKIGFRDSDNMGPRGYINKIADNKSMARDKQSTLQYR